MGHPDSTLDKKYSIEEWLALEEATGIKYEYHFGEIYAVCQGELKPGEVTDMAEGTIAHTIICGNAFRSLENHFEENDGDYQAFISEIKIEIDKAGRYVYPDTLAVCGDVQESTTTVGAVLNPALVIEVTSASTIEYDRVGKFKYYTSLPSVQQYAVVSQVGPLVTL